MKTPRLRVASLTTALLAGPSLVLAHPGHEGDHGLTWDFSHLAAHPLATAICGVMIVATVWGVAQLARRQSLRKSAARRGK